MPKNYTVKEVADILGYSTNSIYSFLKEKRIKGVRVGKGRFRIPETELARVLHVSKREMVPETVGLTSPHMSREMPIDSNPSGGARQETTTLVFLSRHLSLPNLFDWFVGLSAIVTGFALFLFNQTFQSAHSLIFTSISPGIRVALIASGAGVLASSMLPKSRSWHSLFLGILAALGLINTTLLFRAGDLTGSITYGLLALIVGLNAFVDFEGVLSLGLYLSALAVAGPVAIFFRSNEIAIRTLVDFLGISSQMLTLALGISAVLFIALFWFGYRRTGIFFWVSCLVASIALIGVSVFWAQLVFWSRSFFYVTLGFFTAFLPIWQLMQRIESRRKRLLIHGLFGLIGFVLCIMLLAVWGMQINTWEQNRQDFRNKLTYGQTLVASSLESVESALTAAAANPDVLSAVREKDTKKIGELSKILYESNTNIRRLVYLDSKGNGLALYPFGTFDVPNLAFRDYFVKARDTGKLYVSNLFEAAVDQAHRKVVVVSIPLLDAKKNFLGVVAVSVDIAGLGGKLQKVAIGSRGEQFYLADGEGKIVISPEPADIGTDVATDDLLLLAGKGDSGVELHRLRNGVLGIVAYGPVPKYGWVISLEAPATRAYGLSQEAIFSIFTILSGIFVTSLVFMVYFHIFICRLREGSP